MEKIETILTTDVDRLKSDGDLLGSKDLEVGSTIPLFPEK
jgi:hypothetical protein